MPAPQPVRSGRHRGPARRAAGVGADDGRARRASRIRIECPRRTSRGPRGTPPSAGAGQRQRAVGRLDEPVAHRERRHDELGPQLIERGALPTTSMEQMQQGERFSMIDPPSLPLKPDFPNRLKFCGIGLGVGLALGLAVAGGMEALDDRLYIEKEIKDLVPVAFLSEVPEILLPSDERRSIKQRALGWSTAVLVVATILVGSAYTYLHD